MIRHGTPYILSARGMTALRRQGGAFDTALTSAYRERNIGQVITKAVGSCV
jgi:hypothetical protein